MPCREIFLEQPQSYRDAVLPPPLKARVSVEAATQFGWRDLVGDAGETVAIDRFGESAPGEVLQVHFGFTPEKVAEAVRRTIARGKEKA